MDLQISRCSWKLTPQFSFSASIETVNHLLLNTDFKKSDWNTHLQQTYGINKRHANGVISAASCRADGAKEHRILHVKTLEGKIKSINAWIKKAERKLALARNFYAKKKWQNSKTGCNFPIACSLQHKSTNWQNLRFQVHNKKRKLTLLVNKFEHLKVKPIKVFVPYGDIFVVGSKDESFGNQVSQWNGNKITFRVPKCLESRFGKTVFSEVGDFNRNINRLPECGAKTWHFYRKNGVLGLYFYTAYLGWRSRSIRSAHAKTGEELVGNYMVVEIPSGVQIIQSIMKAG